MGVNALIVFSVAALLVRLGLPGAIRFAQRIKLISSKLRVHDGASARGAIPCAGGMVVVGVAVVLSVAYSAAVRQPLAPGMAWVVVGTFAMLIAGMYDDACPLRVGALLAIQTVVALVMLRVGVSISTVILPSVFNGVFTVLWMILMMNALNMLDVLDGLAGGVAAIAAVGLAIAGGMTANASVGVFSAALAGGLLGFLTMNFYPARVYLGNHGSLSIGFLLSTLALQISYAPLGREMALGTPLLILGVPLFDVAFVVWRRCRQRKPLWKGSGDHLALRLIRCGWSERFVVLFFYGCSIVFVASGLLLMRLGNWAGALTLAAAVFVIGLAASRACRMDADAIR